ncbi:hypothetical protein B0H12DRAFT_1007014 [Mycena haematopus]|nr:hypothetical protein B0H12DRAFT_1007014 [Mycena haematopus]
MFATLISVALLAASTLSGVVADDFNIDTPTLTQCQKTTITWDSNQGAVNLIAVKPSDPCGEIVQVFSLDGHDFGDFTNTSFSWLVSYPAGTELQFSAENQEGGEAWSGSMTVGKSNVTSCLPAVSSSAAPSHSSS